MEQRQKVLFLKKAIRYRYQNRYVHIYATFNREGKRWVWIKGPKGYGYAVPYRDLERWRAGWRGPTNAQQLTKRGLYESNH